MSGPRCVTANTSGWRCPNPAAPGRARCENCGEGRRRTLRKAYAKRKKAGTCIDCGTPAYGNATRCRTHMEARAKQASGEMARRKAAGLCTRSGCDEPPAPDRTRCPKHLREANDWAAGYRERRKRKREQPESAHSASGDAPDPSPAPA